MKILVYYKDENDFSYLEEIVKQLSLDIQIDQTNDPQCVIAQYDNSNFYDMVFIDFSCDEAESIIKYITKKKLHQKIVLLNDEYSCFNDKNCSYCKKNLNISTVIKPLNLFQIGSLFNNDFTCESYQKSPLEFNLAKVIKTVVHKYPFVVFNQDEYFFDLSMIVNPLKSTILIELINTLESNGVEHYLLDDVLHIVCVKECKKAL